MYVVFFVVYSNTQYYMYDNNCAFKKLLQMFGIDAAVNDWPWVPLEEESGYSSVDSHSRYYSRSLSDSLEWCGLLVLTQTHASGLHWPERGNKYESKPEDTAEEYNEVQEADQQNTAFWMCLTRLIIDKVLKRSILQGIFNNVDSEIVQ